MQVSHESCPMCMSESSQEGIVRPGASSAQPEAFKSDAQGTSLRLYLTDNGLKIRWLAKRSGITYSRLYRVIRGLNEPTLNEARQIARILSVPIHELFPSR